MEVFGLRVPEAHPRTLLSGQQKFLEVLAVTVFAEVEGGVEDETVGAEKRILGLAFDFLDAGHRFFRDDEVARDDDGHGILANGVGYCPDT